MTIIVNFIRFNHTIHHDDTPIPTATVDGAQATVTIYSPAGVKQLGTLIDEKEAVILTEEEMYLAHDLYSMIADRVMSSM